jgi:serine/threonine protein kinase
MPGDAVALLVDRLQRLRLLEPARLEELSDSLAELFPDSQELAHELERRGWLTPYQADQLLTGSDADLALGPYQLLERLGAGGMGQVFKARHVGLGRLVALKLIHPDRLEDDLALRRFLREARSAAALEHPNVVRAFEADLIGDVPFFTMELVEGTDLAKLVASQGPLSVAAACDCIRQAALGLQHAFERGLVHRDIKPANLIRDSRGVVKLLDLGLARPEVVGQATVLTVEGSTLGTPDFVSPEQARDAHAVDIRSDLYSLGCTLYFLLAGQPPFPGGSLSEKLLRHLLDAPAPLERWRRDVPASVSAVVRRLMAKKPEERYQTPADAAAALEAAPRLWIADCGLRIEDEGATKTASGKGPPANPPSRGRRWLWALAGLAVGGAALALLLWLVLPHRDGGPDGGRPPPKKDAPKPRPGPLCP